MVHISINEDYYLPMLKFPNQTQNIFYSFEFQVKLFLYLFLLQAYVGSLFVRLAS